MSHSMGWQHQARSNTGSPCISFHWVNASWATLIDISLHTFRTCFFPGLPFFLEPVIGKCEFETQTQNQYYQCCVTYLPSCCSFSILRIRWCFTNLKGIKFIPSHLANTWSPSTWRRGWIRFLTNSCLFWWWRITFIFCFTFRRTLEDTRSSFQHIYQFWQDHYNRKYTYKDFETHT